MASSAQSTVGGPPESSAHPEFPPIQHGGSLIIAYQIRGKRVLIIGGGNVAAGRLTSVLSADALVTLISPSSHLSPEVSYRIKTLPHLITYHDRPFDPINDLTPASAPSYDLCLAAIDDPVVSSQIYALCHELRIPCNIADVPSECDFYFGSMHRDGPLQIMVSTNGNGPKLANLIRRQIAEKLPENLGEAITKVGALRKKLRKVAPGLEEGPKRMEWMTKVCETWSLNELSKMNENSMEKLLENWNVWKVEGGNVPGFNAVMEAEEKESEEVEKVAERVETGGGGWFGSLGWF
ncbi:hypothetical protein BDZ91DRAFT_708464 [Kalaharituber pfeilii]|nr:hypothetical protein BDZ91DRAFT_708464 [Kalaharituber pfeilii]